MRADARGRHPGRRRFGQAAALPRRAPLGATGRFAAVPRAGLVGAGRYALLVPLAASAVAALALLLWLSSNT